MLDRKVRVGHAGTPMGSRHLELLRGRGYLRNLADRAKPSLVLASSNNMGLVTGPMIGFDAEGVEGDDDGREVVLVGESAGDDADDAGVPVLILQHQGRRAF